MGSGSAFILEPLDVASQEVPQVSVKPLTLLLLAFPQSYKGVLDIGCLSEVGGGRKLANCIGTD